jgi:two-component system sensor histidine kinase QseC
VAAVLVAVLALWMGAAVITWLSANHEIDELLDGHLAQAAAVLVAQHAAERRDVEIEVQLPDAVPVHRYARRVAFQVWHGSQMTLRSANAPLARLWPHASVPTFGFATLQLDDRPWRVFTTRGAQLGEQVFVAEQMGSRREILRALFYALLGPIVLALPLLGVSVWWAVRRGLLPLHRLGSTLAARAPQALQPVALDAPPAEMLPLLEALNGLLRRIAEMVEAERRFTADAAHELRTPIAAIRAQAQVAQAEPDDAQRRHALEATLQGCDRATHLVERLLTLARLEAAGAAGAQRIDLCALARRVVAEIAPAALARGQELSLHARAPCFVVGEEALLSVLLRNLIDNAVRYSPQAATVMVTLDCPGKVVTLRVEDSGPGLSETDAARLGERFFRVLGSGVSGSGLGWSIVRRIADASQARVQVAPSAALGGLGVEVSWPAAH